MGKFEDLLGKLFDEDNDELEKEIEDSEESNSPEEDSSSDDDDSFDKSNYFVLCSDAENGNVLYCLVQKEGDSWSLTDWCNEWSLEPTQSRHLIAEIEHRCFQLCIDKGSDITYIIANHTFSQDDIKEEPFWKDLLKSNIEGKHFDMVTPIHFPKYNENIMKLIQSSEILFKK